MNRNDREKLIEDAVEGLENYRSTGSHGAYREARAALDSLAVFEKVRTQTDYTKLIEEARAFADNGNGLNWQGRIRELADALEAVDKEHTPTGRAEESDTSTEHGKNEADSSHVTPTNDEREALARRAIRAADEADECGDPVIEAWSDGERFTSDDLRTLAAGFCRSEVPEPSAEMIAPEDGMTLEELGEAFSEASPSWAGDEAMHAIIYRFIEHYALIDCELYAARESTDFEEDAEILFRYDHDSATLVLHTPEPQGEPSEAQAERARIIADLREWSRPLGNSPEEDTLRLVIDRIERATGGAR